MDVIPCFDFKFYKKHGAFGNGTQGLSRLLG